MNQKKIFSLVVLICGLALLWIGYKDYQLLSSQYNPLFDISPDKETKWYLIIGIAASVGGFIGIIRDEIA
ncbi:MAG: DUF3185 family protein [Balneolaceae bacterium]